MFEVDEATQQKSPLKKELPNKKVEIKTPEEEEMAESKMSKQSKDKQPTAKNSIGSDEEDDDECATPTPPERKVVHDKTEAEILAEVMEELQSESVANSLKRKCKEYKIMRPDGFLDPNALALAFNENRLDLDEFTDAL